MSEHFFRDLTGFDDFSEAMQDLHYHSVPGDWLVIVCDVEQSTQAIGQGHYKDVNMVGAACIAAAVNACPALALPYVFGGDGATILIPPSVRDPVVQSLLNVKRHADSVFSLSLRVGMVPVLEIEHLGASLTVAKYIMPTGCCLAMMKGGGVKLADRLVKDEVRYRLQSTATESAPDIHGLSCRWQPIKSRYGIILTLLVTESVANSGPSPYGEINRAITDVLGGMDARPAQVETMRYHWPVRGLKKEAHFVYLQNEIGRRIWLYGFTLFFYVLNRFNLRMRGFDAKRYREEMIMNSDYQKFDDMLRMVIDCSPEQAAAIESYLETLRAQGRVAYGLHRSSQALMTCFVNSLAGDGHVHFIDGDAGGYAIAALQMKQQLLENKAL